jgi:hypothetical protein
MLEVSGTSRGMGGARRIRAADRVILDGPRLAKPRRTCKTTLGRRLAHTLQIADHYRERPVALETIVVQPWGAPPGKREWTTPWAWLLPLWTKCIEIAFLGKR